MKVLFTFLVALVIAYVPAKGQDKSFPSPFRFELIDTVQGVSQNELFSRAQTWLATMFKDSKEVVRLADQSAGKIVGKGLFVTMDGENPFGSVEFQIALDIRDGRWRCILKDFVHTGQIWQGRKLPTAGNLDNETADKDGDYYTPEEVWKSVKKQCFEKSKTLLLSLQKEMEAPAEEKF